MLIKDEVLQRAERLANWVNGKLKPTQVEEYKDLDRLKTEALGITEKKYQKLNMGQIKWCLKIQRARDTSN